jgi:hypothetical protein
LTSAVIGIGYAPNGSELPFPIDVEGETAHICGLPLPDEDEAASSDELLLENDGLL